MPSSVVMIDLLGGAHVNLQVVDSAKAAGYISQYIAKEELFTIFTPNQTLSQKLQMKDYAGKVLAMQAILGELFGCCVFRASRGVVHLDGRKPHCRTITIKSVTQLNRESKRRLELGADPGSEEELRSALMLLRDRAQFLARRSNDAKDVLRVQKGDAAADGTFGTEVDTSLMAQEAAIKS